MDDETIVVTDEFGNEKEYTILFTFDNEDTNKTYVLYYDDNEDETEVFSSVYDENGHLYPVESKEEWDMIEEVFQAFMAQDEE